MFIGQALCTNPTATTTNGMTVGVTANPADDDGQDNVLINNIAGTGDGSALAVTTARVFGGLSDAALIGGGLTNSFAKKIAVVDMPAAGVEVLTNGGITSLQFADANGCDDLDTTISSSGDNNDVALDEYPLVNAAFDAQGNGGGFGLPVTLDSAATAPLMMYEVPEEIGRNVKDIIVVLGIGNSFQLVTDGSFIAKAPRDGNVSGDKYGHFSVALKIGKFQSATVDDVDLTQTETVVAGVSDNKGIDWLDKPQLVAVIDADGDYYEGEIAEFSGLEDE